MDYREAAVKLCAMGFQQKKAETAKAKKSSRWMLSIALGGLLLGVTGISQAATITVNNTGDATADDGKCTLREAITAANADAASGATAGECAAGDLGNDVIDLQGLSGQIVLTGGEISVTGPITLNGPGAATLAITSNGQSRIFKFEINSASTLRDVTFTDAATAFNGGEGGAIHSTSSLMLEGVTLSQNSTSTNNTEGGAIFVVGASLTLKHSLVTGNAAPTTIGGGIYVQNGNLTLKDSSVVTNNSAAEGGGVAVAQGNLDIENSTLEANHSSGDGGGASVFLGTVTLTNAVVTGNYTTGSAAEGGGLHVIGNINITGSEITNNYTSLDSSEGGGFYASDNATVTNSVITNNKVKGDSDGAGAYVSGSLQISNSTFASNVIEGSGSGAGADSGGAVTVDNSAFINNVIQGGTGRGAGLNVHGSIINISNSTFSGNSGNGIDGSAIAADLSGNMKILHSTIVGVPSSTSGSALWLLSNSPLDIRNTIIDPRGLVNTSACRLQHLPVADVTGMHNLITDETCDSGVPFLVGSGTNGVTTTAELKMSSLADNGATTQTHALLLGSVAIDAADTTACNLLPAPQTDQRGMPRPTDGDGNGTAACDIGAFEAGAIHLDFGDAPDSYGTTAANDGARHIDTGVLLGALRDTENEGQPSADAAADGADEDGLSVPVSVEAGTNLSFLVNVNGSTTAVLNAWLDKDANGSFADAGEQLAHEQVVTTAGPNNVQVPADVPAGDYFLRARVCSTETTCDQPTGLAIDGEVEDYKITVTPNTGGSSSGGSTSGGSSSGGSTSGGSTSGGSTSGGSTSGGSTSGGSTSGGSTSGGSTSGGSTSGGSTSGGSTSGGTTSGGSTSGGSTSGGSTSGGSTSGGSTSGGSTSGGSTSGGSTSGGSTSGGSSSGGSSGASSSGGSSSGGSSSGGNGSGASCDTLSGGDGTVICVSAGSIQGLQQVAVPGFAPGGLEYSNGFFKYSITGLSPGQSVTVTARLPSGNFANRIVKCNAASCALFAGTIENRVATFTLTDNGVGDTDATPGIIGDPVAFAYKDEGGGCTMVANGNNGMGWLLLGMFGLWTFRLRKSKCSLNG